LDGIVIKPCLPSAWEEVSVKRIYRGTTYDIRISNPSKKAGAAVESIKINGTMHEQSQPLPIDGGSHLVEVTLEY
jgi:cellobiose phosphorylase